MKCTTLRLLGVVVLLTTSIMPTACRERPAPEVIPFRVAVLTLGETGRDIIGPVINADTLRHAADELRADQPDILVLVINSPGGMVAEVPELSDLVHTELAPDFRVVAWVKRAASAAALLALTCDEIAMTPDGILGGVVTYDADPDGTLRPITDHDTDVMINIGHEVTARGGHHPHIIEAMQVPTGLSRDENGWRLDDQGQSLVCAQGEILVFNAKTAAHAGVSLGIAETLEDVMTLLGVASWTLVGEETDVWLTSKHAEAAIALRRASELMGVDGPDQRAEIAQIVAEHPLIGRYLGIGTREPGSEESPNEAVGAAIMIDGPLDSSASRHVGSARE